MVKKTKKIEEKDGITILNMVNPRDPFSSTVSLYLQNKYPFQLWGSKNNKPEFLLESSLKSPILKGILQKEKIRIFADGLIQEDDKPIEDHPLFKVNDTENINDLTRKLITDLSNLSCYSLSNRT